MKLDNVKWGEFKIVDVFKVKNSHSILASEVTANSGNIPYLCASSDNNGVDSYISYNPNLIDEGNCIFIGGKTFVVTYQKKDFFSNDSHNLALYLNENDCRTELIQLFLASCIQKGLSHLYSWGDSISNQKIQKDVCLLPVKNEQIDFVFMKSFIHELEKEKIQELKIYLKARGLDNYKLTEEETSSLTEFQNKEWKTFKIGDLFDVLSTKKKYDSNKIQLEESGHPYIVRTSLNNGMKGRLNADPQTLNEGNTISFGQDTVTIFYQKEPYFTGDKIKILKPSFDVFDSNIALFVISSMVRSFSHFSWGASSFNVQVIEKQPITLPVIHNEIDFSYIKTLVTSVQKLVIKDAVKYTEQKIKNDSQTNG